MGSNLGDSLGLARSAENQPDRIALLQPGRNCLNYRDLWNHIQTVEQALHRAGIESGDVIATVLPNGPESITTFLAAAGIGSCAPLDPALTEDDYRYYFKRLETNSVILLAGGPSAALDAARSLGLRIVTVNPRLDQPAGIFELRDVDGNPNASLGRKIDAAVLLFTSATTDAAKLVPLTWSNLRAIAHNDSRALGLTREDRLLSLMPLFHLHGLAAALTQLSVGGSVITAPGFDPNGFVGWLTDLRPTWLCSNPPMSRAILALARNSAAQFPKADLRFIRSGTAASEPDLLETLETIVGVPVIDGYGLTETGGVTRNTRRPRKPGSVGTSSGLELAIAGPDGRLVEAETEGEIVVRGASVSGGYLDNPEANQHAFRDGWFHTGDLGRLDDEGFLFITGRLKDVINRGGKKIAPREVEAILLSHRAVAEAAVCAIAHATLGEDVAAAVVVREGMSATESELRQFVSAKLPAFKVPRRIVVLDSIPRTATGKPKRERVAELVTHRTLSDQLAARTPDRAESVIIEIWRRLLAVDKIYITDDFFALGGDSLSAAVMLTEVHRALATNKALLERLDFFDNATVETLARLAAECGADDPAMPPAEGALILPLRTPGTRIPIFAFPASAQDPYYFRYLSKAFNDGQPFYVVSNPAPIQDGRLRPVEDLARASLEAIRRVRPTGPYIIAGHCYGGVVAYETAQQMMEQGQQVVSLILFDCNTPGYPKVHKQWKRYVAKGGQFASALGRGKALVSPKQLRQHLHMLAHIFARRRKGDASRVLNAIGSDVLVAGRQQKELNGMAMWEYTPRGFRSPIIHFIAEDQPISTEILSDPRLGWNDFARAGIDILHVRGDHNTILAAENVADIANHLNAALPQPELAMSARNGE